MATNYISELKWRGLLQDIMPGTEELLSKEVVTGYIGFDPTADSLHIGSLVQIILLLHMQKAGHKPIALLGGATGMVGDPTGKSEERVMLTKEVLEKNTEGIKKQLEKYIDFSDKENGAILVNNYDWFQSISFLEFIRDAGKFITVNYMMAKDSVKKRLESANGMSFTEFTYQLIQGYDFYYLNKTLNAKLQCGGSDQWGNIVTGTELIRKKSGNEVIAFTSPLIKKADGGKFGKTESGNIWLDPEKTSPYHFYQFWLNATDEDAENWIKIFTFLPKEGIDNLIADHKKDPGKRQLQKELAKELTKFIHGEDEFKKAIETTEKLFSNQHADIKSLSISDLENIEGIEKKSISKTELENGIGILDLLTNTAILPSKGESRKMIQNNGISINREKQSDVNAILKSDILLHDKYILVQKGKRNYYLIEAE